uniref:EGF-like domain-containing protein n=1 Tax=Ditylenchus dipsaci TaxID=166011 RepID=A0A915D0B3_9BILA
MCFLNSLIFCYILLQAVECHVSWQYPAARSPPFDGLDSRITKQPCGVPRPQNANFSNFAIGIPYNFTWRMDNNHQAGLRISLYNSSGDGRKISAIADEAQDFFIFPIHQVTFDSVCSRCILRLEKQGVDNSYVLPLMCRHQCVSKCQKRTGKEAMDCVEDSDCGAPHGLCVAQPNSSPLKICYCPNGRFGKNCEKNSSIESNDCFNTDNSDSSNFSSYGIFNKSCYKRVKLNGKDFVYSRLLQNNRLEVILDFGTDSFVSIGWRPVDTNTLVDTFLHWVGKRMALMDLWTKSLSHPYPQWIAQTFRDLSNPLDDDWFGGKDSITDVRGWQLEDFEAGLRTIVLFRRKVKASEPSDHPLGPGPMFGIYAKGPTSKSEGESTDLVENEERIFFQLDEIDFKGENRAWLSMTL